jgi:hypothetical protein
LIKDAPNTTKEAGLRTVAGGTTEAHTQ